MKERIPCETCKEAEQGCDQKRDFMARFFLRLFDPSRPSCKGYDPAWYRGIEGVLR